MNWSTNSNGCPRPWRAAGAAAAAGRARGGAPARRRGAGGGGRAGDPPRARETVEAIRRDGVRVGIAVLLVNLVLLGLFLRAIGAPIYLLAASVLALATAL